MQSYSARLRRSQSLGIKTLEHLRFLLRISNIEFERILASPDSYFEEFQKEIKGKVRNLVDVMPPLKQGLRQLNARLQLVKLPTYMQGGIKGRSSVTNALLHVGADTVLKADIKDFFPSISPRHVELVCRKRLLCSAQVSKAIAAICTFKGALPQGAPTSTMLANFVIEHLAFRLKRLAEQRGATYSQYVDDLAISGPRHVDNLKHLVVDIIESEGFVCHPDKLILCRRSDEHEVTGVRINNGKDVPSKTLGKVREALTALNKSNIPPSSKERLSLEGRIRHIGTLNKGAGKHLCKRLHDIIERCSRPLQERERKN